jgi:hypothetical protein
MPITFISRDYGVNVSIVRVTTTDTLETVFAPGYLTAQVANLAVVNNGGFTWLAGDEVLVSGSDGNRFGVVSGDLSSILASGGSLLASVSLTPAQFEAIYATPVLLVSAPGPKQMIVVNSWQFALAYGTTQYTLGGAIKLQYEATVHAGGVAASATLAAATVNGLTASTVENGAGVTSIVYAAAAGQPLYLSNATQAFASGDSNIVVTANYSIITLA